MMDDEERKKKAIEASRRWCANNRERVKATKRLYYENNRERINERMRQYYRRNPEKFREYSRRYRKERSVDREAHLKRYYDLSSEQYDEMLASQGGRCGICRSDSPGSRQKYFSVDHKHSTGQIRGLLCGRCNLWLGHAEKDGRLQKAADYLRG